MASKNSIKLDIEGGFYHVYNRGVEKREIFEDEMDYRVFLNYLKEYLSPKRDKNLLVKPIYIKDRVFDGMSRIPNNYYGKIDLLCYCLMPNHFHFLIRQNNKGQMKEFMHSLLLRYSTYFNKKNFRIGPLFQGRYKAVLVDNEGYLLHLSRYIHLNPSELNNNLIETYSSYKNYLGLVNTQWVDTKIILDYFKDNRHKDSDFKRVGTYNEFILYYKVKDLEADVLKDLILE